MTPIYAFLCAIVIMPAAWGQVSTVALPKVMTTDPYADVALGLPLEGKAPKYPKNAVDNKREGSVVLVLTVDDKGNVTNVSATSGDEELVKAAIKAVRDWKYAPYFLDGKVNHVTTTVIINFKLDETGKPEISVSYKKPTSSIAGDIFKVGSGVSAPKLLFSADPVYTEEARRQKYQGVCVLSLIVTPDGRTRDIHITRALGYGLNEKAIEAVSQWRFKPAMKDGQPVAVVVAVEVSFHLY